MKKFIIISLLLVLTLPTCACGWYGTDNYYLFSPYPSNAFKARIEKICNDNWKAYLGVNEEYWWFNSDEVIKAAQQKGDALMVSYVKNLKNYLDCVDVEQQKQHEWNYPTKEDIADQQRNLQTIRAYALGKTKTRLRSQHALLYMRCNMMLGLHQENITFWEQTASNYIETVYKDMMKNIYAGALYKTGHEAEAGELFAEMDDYESLMTQFYKKRSYLAISQHYRQNPQSKVLPFLLADFVNNTQEAHDQYKGGKLFIRDIDEQESWQMQQFCELVVREGKTEFPMMWKTAKAWLEFMSGKKEEASKDIAVALKLEGTERMKDNARVIQFYITTAQAKQSKNFDNYLAEELAWLKEKGEEDSFFRNAENRITNQLLIKHYQDSPERMAAIANVTNGIFNIDTLGVDKVENYLTYIHTPAKNKLDQFLKANLNENDTTIMELIGTKYMRICQWDKAIEWLEKVPISYYNSNKSQEYLCYSLIRSYEVEPWIKRQWINYNMIYSKSWKWWKHRKLNFCKEMQMLESSLNLLKGKTLEQRYYNLAIRYAQASINGDCWWLLHNSKSYGDTVQVHETDFAKKAVMMLQKAAITSDPDLKLKSLFALGYRELYNDGADWLPHSGKNYWRKGVWNSSTYEQEYRYNHESPQFRAYQTLFELVEDEPEEPMYISKCDEFTQFRKYYRQHR